MITPPDTTAAEKFRRGIGGHYDREVVGIAAAIASARVAEQERCAAIADAMADEKDVLALGADDSNITPYREGERTAQQIAAAIRGEL